MDFNTTIGTKLLIQVEGNGTRLWSFLVGYARDQFVLVTTPASDNLFSVRPSLFLDYRINVRYIEDGRAVGFQAKLLKATEEPARLLFLSYPERIEDQELRAQKRASCALPAEMSMPGLTCDAVIVDINQAGLRFYVKEEEGIQALEPNPVGQECTVRFLLPGDTTHKEVTGEIRNCERKARVVAFGIKFTGISDAVRENIIAFESRLKL